MKKILITLIFLFESIIAYANDTVINSYGGILLPVKETRIELKKEILEFTEIGNELNASVYFEFYNPDESKDITVGFIAAPGSSPSDKNKKPNIMDFTVRVNDINLEHSFYKIDSVNTDFIDYKDWYVYAFQTTFKHGINRIKHSYKFEYSFNSHGIRWFDYVLQSGLLWGNSEIENFKLIINLGGKSRLQVPYNFGRPTKEHDWDIEGIGKLADTDHSDYLNRGSGKSIFAYIINGNLTFHQKHFKPAKNLHIIKYDPIQNSKTLQTLDWNEFNNEHIKKLTGSELRLARNTLFAIHGYKFKNNDLLEYFSKYFWYMPDEDVLNSISILSPYEKELFDRIVKLEKLKKDKTLGID